VQVDGAGDIVAAGSTYSTGFDSQTNTGYSDVMVMKFSSAGTHQWTVLRGGSSYEYAYSLKAERAGLFVVHVPTHLLEKH